ncbi:DNA internalization-related competence protein ComEC/Rec2 [Metaplanococcus flavidus]|uniref:DNA internalization-related competence protein ComEC/Rec2 n=1 Tax=Metaplanococcus flavidus TaxID=569883 RepID=A0ABW3L8W8_9BACL
MFMSILLVAAGIFIVQDIRHAALPEYSGQYDGQAEFQEGFKIDGDSVRGFLRLEDGGLVYANYRFATPQEKEEKEGFVRNSVWRVSGIFEEPAEAAHDYSFDMKNYLKDNGASSVLSLQMMEFQNMTEGFAAALSNRRENLKQHIRTSFPPALTAEAEALLIGERKSISTEQQRIQQTLGISHLFAISGLHVGIISGLLYLLMLRCGIRKETAMILLLMILPLYAFMAGGAPSVWRAVSMTAAVLVLKLFRVRIPIATILLLSFIFFITINPYIIYKIGFQLSYGASFGIIYSLKLLETAKSPVRKGLLITFISQFTLYPILLFHFFGLSISSFAVNSLFVPLYTLLILPMNLLLLALTLLFQPAADFVFFFYEPFRTFVEHWTIWLAEWPHQMWIPGKPDGVFLGLMIAGIILFYSLVEKGFRWWKIAIGVVPAIVFAALPYFDGSLKVTIIDVGQGDSALIQLPYRKGVYLIDTGGVLRFGREGFSDRDRPFEIGRQIVAPYLHGNGITRIDKMILSHPDADHAEGADEILQLFDVTELHLSPGSQNSEIMKELEADLDDTVIRLPGQGSQWQSEEISFTYLSPDDGNYEGNNDSLVLLMEYDGFKLLFTGDLETDGENEILGLYGEQLADITLLKVGHHGSKTSSGDAFLTKLRPELSIFSAGKDNRYGHPAQEVVKRFETLALPTLSTAEQGTIEIIFQDGIYTVNTSK